MKKYYSLLLFVVLAWTATAQTADTLPFIYKNYHYSTWYDSCQDFFDTDVFANTTLPRMRLFVEGGVGRSDHSIVKPEHVDRPTKILGISVAEATNEHDYDIRYIFVEQLFHAEEYAYLVKKQPGTDYGFTVVDSVRWDTAAPKYMRWPLNVDTDRFGYKLVRVYEARFKAPVEVDSTFFIHSSRNGERQAPSDLFRWDYAYLPVKPIFVFNSASACEPAICARPSWHTMYWYDSRNRRYGPPITDPTSPEFGLYFPMVDYVSLQCVSADTSMGMAEPFALVTRDMYHTIKATPRLGYRFTHWSDGDRHKVRDVYVTQDTTVYVAYFDTTRIVNMQLFSSDWALGSVEGGGLYNQGDTVLIEAIPTPQQFLVDETVDTLVPLNHYVVSTFSHWSDGDTTNPRRVEILQDTMFTAYFSKEYRFFSDIESVDNPALTFSIAPNPAHDMVTIRLTPLPKETVVMVIDVKGHEMLHDIIPARQSQLTLPLAHFPKGTYFVTLAMSDKTATAKLMVE